MELPRGLAFVLIFALVVHSGIATAQNIAEPAHISQIQDWSQNHVIYTGGGSIENAVAARQDPRLRQSWIAHSLHRVINNTSEEDSNATGNVRSDDASAQADERRCRHHGHRCHKPPHNVNSHLDWAVSLGALHGVAKNQYPAKFSFNPNAPPDCTNDFVIFPINAAPAAGGQANLVAFNNLYSGTSPTGLCGTAPTFLWSYAVGTGNGSLSPTPSLDGKKVAFVEYSAANRARFHVLTWVAGQGTDATHSVAPGTGGSVDVNLDYTNIAVPGCTTIASTVSQSSPYIDYSHDTAFITANNGRLYHVSGVFNGTPTVDFCVVVNNGAALTSAVYDYVDNELFVCDSRTVYAYTVGSTSFTLVASHQVTTTTGSLTLSPIVDVTNGFVYLFVHDSAALNVTAAQLPVSLGSQVSAAIGQAPALISYGYFDNAYFASGPAAGTLYACGATTTDNTVPAMFAMSFASNGVMNSTPVLSNNQNINPGQPSGTCSPMMEFYDGTNDRLFVSTTGSNTVTMWNINSRITSSSATPTASGNPYLGGTSGFVVDNTSTQAQAASFYFGSLGTGATATCGANLYCAVKLTQSGLK